MDLHINGCKDAYQNKKQDLEQKSDTLLEELQESGIKFECLYTIVREAIKTRTSKILENHRHKDLDEDQLKLLRKSEIYKKEADEMMEDYRHIVGDKTKDIIKNTDSIEISRKPWKLIANTAFVILKLNRNIKKEFGSILNKLHKPLKLLNSYRQDLYEREYHKNWFERLMGAKFDFNRSIIEKKNAPWIYKTLDFFVKDIQILGDDAEPISFKGFKKVTKNKLKYTKKSEGNNVTQELNRLLRKYTQFGQNIEEIEKLKQEGKRVFIVIPHPSYLGAVMPRYAMLKLGFHDLAQNWNFVCGPRVLSSWIMKRGVRTIGNLFMTLPSTETTPVQTPGLKRQLQLLSLKTNKIIALGEYEKRDIDKKEKLQQKNEAEEKINWELGERAAYQKLQGEVFVVAPEGSRSNESEDGDIHLKYCSSDLFGTFIRPGDYIVPLSQTGSEKILPKRKTRFIKLKRNKIGISIGKPMEVTETMINNGGKQEAMDMIMSKVCELPSLTNLIHKPISQENTLSNESIQEIEDSQDTTPKKNL